MTWSRVALASLFGGFRANGLSPSGASWSVGAETASGGRIVTLCITAVHGWQRCVSETCGAVRSLDPDAVSVLGAKAGPPFRGTVELWRQRVDQRRLVGLRVGDRMRGAVLAGGEAAISWRKSSYSSTQEDDCCEIALRRTQVWVRDSKCPERATLRFSVRAWRSAVASLRADPFGGGFDG
ncbi:DUF397 domain-containing protein [Streptomyces tendae]|uniref:DUF397 domain-containing protein n=2 Tax=Streptomyces tendae TaxID=1932 RepID=UPI0033B4A520